MFSKLRGAAQQRSRCQPVVRSGLLLIMLGLAQPAIAVELVLVSALEDPMIYGVEGNDRSTQCALSRTGRRVAFLSDATNLVPGDTNGVRDAFVKDRQTGTIERINYFGDGSQTVNDLWDISVSNNGRYLAFVTEDDLLGDGADVTRRVYHLDRQTSELTLASVDQAGLPISAGSGTRISGNGQFVLFTESLLGDIWRFDSDTDAVVEVSTDSAGQSGDFSSRIGDISNDGEVVLFDSVATNLVPGDTNGTRDAFVKDLTSGITTRVSVTDTGAEVSGSACAISDDGAAVLFSSGSPIISGEPSTPQAVNIYRHQLSTGNLQLASSGLGGDPGDASSTCGVVGRTPRQVAFSSLAGNLGPLPNGHLQAFLKDMSTGDLSLIGTAAGDLDVWDMSGDGAFVCATSLAPDVVGGDSNAVSDVFVIETATSLPERVSTAETPLAVAVDAQYSESAAMDAAGRWVVFSSGSAFLDADNPPAVARAGIVFQAYLFDTQTGDQTLLSRSASGAHGNDSSGDVAISPNGRFAAFLSDATDLTNDASGNPAEKVFRVDLQTMELLLVAPDTDGCDGIPSISDDGAVAYSSYSSQGGGDNCQINVWLPSNPPVVASQSESGLVGDADSCCGIVSGDGQRVAFLSNAGNLAGGPSDSGYDVFVKDLVSGAVHRVTMDSGSLSGTRSLGFSGDGLLVAFDDGDDGNRIELFDMVTGITTDLYATDAPPSVAFRPVLSSNGEFLLFMFRNEANGDNYLMRYQVDTGERVQLPGLPGLKRESDRLAISNSGSQFAFQADEPLVPADSNHLSDIYVLRSSADELSGLLFQDSFETRPVVMAGPSKDSIGSSSTVFGLK